MFWNISAIILSIALLVIFIGRTLYYFLGIPCFIPVALVFAVVSIYLNATRKKYTKGVVRFAMISVLLSGILGFIQAMFL